MEAEVPLAPAFTGTGSGVDALSGQTSARAGRRDGREAVELRALKVTQGVLARADGSARVHVGGTDVVVAVYGPMECGVGRQVAERADVHVAYGGGAVEREAEGVLAKRELRGIVMEAVLTALNPRKAIAVAVQVLADCGGLQAAAINAAVLALMDAGLPMSAVPTAACVSVHNGAIVVDPVSIEEAEGDAVLTFTYDTALEQSAGFLAVSTYGDCGGEDVFAAAASTARELAFKTRAFLRLSMESRAQQRLAWSTFK